MDTRTTTTIRLSVRLLGRMSIHIDDRPLRIAGRQSQALFALLVLRPRSRTREAIATDLWPDAASGSRSQVSRQYRRLKTLLADEIGEAPLPETIASYRAAMTDAVIRSRRRVASAGFRIEPLLALAASS